MLHFLRNRKARHRADVRVDQWPTCSTYHWMTAGVRRSATVEMVS